MEADEAFVAEEFVAGDAVVGELEEGEGDAVEVTVLGLGGEFVGEGLEFVAEAEVVDVGGEAPLGVFAEGAEGLGVFDEQGVVLDGHAFEDGLGVSEFLAHEGSEGAALGGEGPGSGGQGEGQDARQGGPDAGHGWTEVGEVRSYFGELGLGAVVSKRLTRVTSLPRSL